MKPFAGLLLAVMVLAGCDASKEVAAAGPDCTSIVSAIKRLACFDAIAGTPPQLPELAPVVAPAIEPDLPVHVPDIVSLVRRNESRRKDEQTGMLLLRVADALPGRSSVVISAPALGGAAPRPLLAISCLQNISRLQLLTEQPVEVNHLNIRILLDGRPISPSRPWQVLEDGSVTDVGRGLVAIEQLRYLTRPVQQLQLESDHAPFDGLSFDVTALHELMRQQREACHW